MSSESSPVNVAEVSVSTGRSKVLLWIVLPLLIGLGLALLIPRPIVGLIYLNDSIHSYSAGRMISQIHHARDIGHLAGRLEHTAVQAKVQP